MSKPLSPRERKARIVRAISAWNTGQFDHVAEDFSEDVELSSPNLEATYGIIGPLRGKHNVVAQFHHREPEFPKALALRDILLGSNTTTILLDTESGSLAWTTKEALDGTVLRIIVAYSVGVSFGDDDDDDDA